MAASTSVMNSTDVVIQGGLDGSSRRTKIVDAIWRGFGGLLKQW